jgi:hypothetical protein
MLKNNRKRVFFMLVPKSQFQNGSRSTFTGRGRRGSRFFSIGLDFKLGLWDQGDFYEFVIEIDVKTLKIG